MHAVCTVVTKNLHMITDIIENKTNDGDWDYANIGGRYSNSIPVKKNTKNLFRNMGLNIEEYYPNGYPYYYTQYLTNNNDCKYVSVARLRNIDLEEMRLLRANNLLDPFNPYRYILCENEDNYNEFETNQHGNELLLDFIHEPRHSFYYVAVIDYHF